MTAPRIRVFRDFSSHGNSRAVAEEPDPSFGRVPWRAVFGNDRPVEVEIGCARAGFLVAAAAQNPARNFFGLERAPRLVARACAAIEKAQLTNIRVLGCDARCVIRHLIQPHSVAAYHLYFPDPWWKRRHYRRRLYAGAFAVDLTRTLAADGRVHVATDVPELLAAVSQQFFDAGLQSLRQPHGAVETTFAQRCLEAGRPVHQATFAHRQGSSRAP